MDQMKVLKHIGGLAELVGKMRGLAELAAHDGHPERAAHMLRYASEGGKHLDELAAMICQAGAEVRK